MDTQALRTAYADALRRYIAARVDGSAVEDILQQVFIKVHQQTASPVADGAVKSRLYRVTQTTIIDRYRSEARAAGLLPDETRELLEDSTQHDQHTQLARRIASCVLPLVDSLDGTTKRIMEQYLQGTMSLREIAETLGLTESNVKVQIHRAKKQLKTMYDQCCTQYRDERGNLIDTRCTKDCGCDAG